MTILIKLITFLHHLVLQNYKGTISGPESEIKLEIPQSPINAAPRMVQKKSRKIKRFGSMEDLPQDGEKLAAQAPMYTTDKQAKLIKKVWVDLFLHYALFSQKETLDGLFQTAI